MKKRLIIGGFLLSSGLALASSTYADASTTSTQNRKAPSGFSQLSETDSTTLESLTGSARIAFLTSKGITKKADHTGSGGVPPDIFNLSDTEKTSLESMTEGERQAFFESKGLTRPNHTGSGKIAGRKTNTLTSGSTRLSDQKKQESSTLSDTASSTVTTQSRDERIKANAAKLLEQRKVKLQKKITAGESLNRLEKKFATANGIEY